VHYIILVVLRDRAVELAVAVNAVLQRYHQVGIIDCSERILFATAVMLLADTLSATPVCAATSMPHMQRRQGS
jgi:hypothetical protein